MNKVASLISFSTSGEKLPNAKQMKKIKKSEKISKKVLQIKKRCAIILSVPQIAQNRYYAQMFHVEQKEVKYGIQKNPRKTV